MDKSQSPVVPIEIKYMNEEGIKVSAMPILVLPCFVFEMAIFNLGYTPVSVGSITAAETVFFYLLTIN